MGDYNVEIQGKYNLDEINKQISGEEAGASQFVKSVISDDGINNIVTFKELSPGTLPNNLKLLKEGDAKPVGTNQIWSGSMIIAGTKMTVAAYRSS